MTDSLPKYSIDTGALVEGFSRVYPPRVFEGLWARMSQLAADGRLLVAENCMEELRKLDGDLVRWIRNRRGMIISPTARQLDIAQALVDQFPILRDNPASQAESNPWVVAVAVEHGCQVVTEEKRGTDENPKIVQQCQHLNVAYMRFLDVALNEGWVFSLPPDPD